MKLSLQKDIFQLITQDSVMSPSLHAFNKAFWTNEKSVKITAGDSETRRPTGNN